MVRFLLICLLCLSDVPGAVEEWPVWLLRGCSSHPQPRAVGTPPCCCACCPQPSRDLAGTGRCVGLCLVLTHPAGGLHFRSSGYLCQLLNCPFESAALSLSGLIMSLSTACCDCVPIAPLHTLHVCVEQAGRGAHSIPCSSSTGRTCEWGWECCWCWSVCLAEPLVRKLHLILCSAS